MIERNGDLFTTDARAIGHGVNTHGVMGAGIAKTFKQRYPEMFKVYRRHCEIQALRPGMSMSWSGMPNVGEHDAKWVFNMASQENPGPDAKYTWLFTAAAESARIAGGTGLDRIAIPEIGCGIGGLEWRTVKRLLEIIENDIPNFEWEVWHYA